MQGGGRLAGRAAIVTGGSRGIGAAITDKFRADGARVAVFDLDVSDLEEHSDLLPLTCDITDERQVERAVATAAQRYEGIDILVNNAGVNTYFDATTMTEEQWDEVFAVDLKGAWLCSKHVLPHLLAAGGGAIVNIASIHARTTIKGMFPYAAAKYGMIGLTRSLALDYADRNVRANAVCPGWTRTRLVEDWFAKQPDPRSAEKAVLEVHPLGRIATPGEIANVVAFVACDEASFMTGAEVYVDGGLSTVFPT
jgi:NAD(P)-dependent dehydrogenase (short-subunit alcohol dehydrogenase family)